MELGGMHALCTCLYASLFSSLQVLCLDLCALTLGPVEGMLWQIKCVLLETIARMFSRSSP